MKSQLPRVLGLAAVVLLTSAPWTAGSSAAAAGTPSGTGGTTTSEAQNPPDQSCVVGGLQMDGACPANTASFTATPSPALIQYPVRFVVTVPPPSAGQGAPEPAGAIEKPLPKYGYVIVDGKVDRDKRVDLNPSDLPNQTIRWTPKTATLYFALTEATFPGAATPHPCPYTAVPGGSYSGSQTCAQLPANGATRLTFTHIFQKPGKVQPQLRLDWDIEMPYSLSLPLENDVPYQTLNCMADPPGRPNYWPNAPGGNTSVPNNYPVTNPSYCTPGNYTAMSLHTWPLDTVATNSFTFDNNVSAEIVGSYQPKPLPSDRQTTRGSLDIITKKTYAECLQCSTYKDTDGYCFDGWHTAVNEPGDKDNKRSEHYKDVTNGGYYDYWSKPDASSDPGGSNSYVACLGWAGPNQNAAGPAGGSDSYYWDLAANLPRHGNCPPPCGDHDDWTGAGANYYNTIEDQGSSIDVVVANKSTTVAFWGQPKTASYDYRYFAHQSVTLNFSDVASTGQTLSQYGTYLKNYLYAGVTGRSFTPDPNLLQASEIFTCPVPNNLSDPTDWVNENVGRALVPGCTPNYDRRAWTRFWTSPNAYGNVAPSAPINQLSDNQTPTLFENDSFKVEWPTLTQQWPNPNSRKTYVSKWTRGDAYYPDSASCKETKPNRDPDGGDYGQKDNYTSSVASDSKGKATAVDGGEFSGGPWLIDSVIDYTRDPSQYPVTYLDPGPCGREKKWPTAGNPVKYDGYSLSSKTIQDWQVKDIDTSRRVLANLDTQSTVIYQICCVSATPSYDQLRSTTQQLDFSPETWTDGYQFTLFVDQEQPVQG